MLASAASSKDGAVRAECISVIRKALKHLDSHSIRSYTKMSLLLKATHNFLGDASASCRQNARVLADELAGLLGGIPEYVALMRQYMPGRQVDEVCRALGGAWCQHDATAPPPSPPGSARSASSRLASRSPSRPSRLASTSPSRHRASSTHRAPTSPALSATTGGAGGGGGGGGGDVPPETTHAATPSLADLVHAQVEKKACTQFRPRWGNPSMCDSCKLKKEAHSSGPTGGSSGLRRPQTSGTHARPTAAAGTTGAPPHKRLNLNGTLTSASASSASGMSARSSKRSGTTLGHGKPSSPVGMRRSTSSSSKPGGAATARERATTDRSHAWETASQNSRTSAASRASKASTARHSTSARRNTSQPHKPPPTPPLASPTSAASGSGRMRTSSTAAAAAKAAQRSAARSASPAQAAAAAAAAAAPTSPTLAKPARKKTSGGADLVGKLDQAIIEEMRSFLVTKKAQQQQQQNSPRECDSERSTSGGGASVAASVIEAEAAHKAELGRLREAHQKEMEEKDKMIFSLLKENMQLKLDLEKAKEVRGTTLF